MSAKNLAEKFASRRKDERQDSERPLQSLYFHSQKASRLASALHSLFEERDEIYLDQIDIIGVRELASEVVFHANATHHLHNLQNERELNEVLSEARKNQKKP